MNTPNQLCQVFKRRFPMKIQIKTTTLKKSQWVQTPSAEVAFWEKNEMCRPKKENGAFRAQEAHLCRESAVAGFGLSNGSTGKNEDI